MSSENKECDDFAVSIRQKDYKRSECGCCRQRWLLALMGLWMGIMIYMLSSNMSIAIVCMVKHHPVKSTDTINNISVHAGINGNASGITYVNPTTPEITDTETKGIQNNEETNSCEHLEKYDIKDLKGAEFSWSKEIQSFVLSSYYYGYLIMQIPGGYIAAKFGGKLVVAVSIFNASLSTILVPVCARTSVYILMLTRVLLGLCLGMSLPAFAGLVGIWALPEERSRFMAMCWFGLITGAVLGYASSGFLCVHGFSNGWDSIFYVHGMIGVLFVIVWLYVVYSSPEQHPRISESERALLSKRVDKQTPQSTKVDKIPWTHMLRHIPVYVVFLSHICDNCTFYMLFTCLPQFMQQVLKIDPQSNGLLSCLPFITLMIGIGSSGFLADFMLTRKLFSVTATRKIFQITGLVGLTVFIVVPGYLSCEHKTLAIACLCLCTLFEGGEMAAGYSTNMIDIAPRYASIIFAISNTVATIPGMVAPTLVAAITTNETVEEWRVIFYISGGVSLFTAVVYGLFASSELAPWARLDTDIDIKHIELDIYSPAEKEDTNN